jgi:hypothetical protein
LRTGDTRKLIDEGREMEGLIEVTPEGHNEGVYERQRIEDQLYYGLPIP